MHSGFTRLSYEYSWSKWFSTLQKCWSEPEPEFHTVRRNKLLRTTQRYRLADKQEGQWIVTLRNY